MNRDGKEGRRKREEGRGRELKQNVVDRVVKMFRKNTRTGGKDKYRVANDM